MPIIFELLIPISVETPKVVTHRLSLMKIHRSNGSRSHPGGAAQSYSQRGCAARARGRRAPAAQCVGARRRRHGQPTFRLTRRAKAQEKCALEVSR